MLTAGASKDIQVFFVLVSLKLIPNKKYKNYYQQKRTTIVIIVVRGIY